MPGPLAGLRIIELAGIGPAPFCGMMLADHGAEVIRVGRIGSQLAKTDPLSRSRRSILVNLKRPEGVEVVRALAKRADGFIEGFRPGVMERLGLGPERLLTDNAKLVYGRMTGWGQQGPLAGTAGHDINYISLSGALHTCGRAGGQPSPPVNYLGDFGGGGMLLAFGMVSALLHVKNGGVGQVLDCAMSDGSALLTAMTRHLYAEGRWRDEVGVNLLDTGAPFYDTYETADGKWISIGALEPGFYAELLARLGLGDDEDLDARQDPTTWPRLKRKLANIVRGKRRAEWERIFEGSDACVAPVLSLAEAPMHPHNAARGTFVEIDGCWQPAPAPRYSATPAGVPGPVPAEGADSESLLAWLGYDAAGRRRLFDRGIVG